MKRAERRAARRQPVIPAAERAMDSSSEGLA
jgi:hypothetical protein